MHTNRNVLDVLSECTQWDLFTQPVEPIPDNVSREQVVLWDCFGEDMMKKEVVTECENQNTSL